jgi:hypothetical protein
LDKRKLTILGVVATVSAASALYGLYKVGLINDDDFNRLLNPFRKLIPDKQDLIE